MKLRSIKLITDEKMQSIADSILEAIRDKEVTTIGVDLTGSQVSGGFSWNVAVVPEFMEHFDDDSCTIYEEAMNHFWEMDMSEEEAEEAYNNSQWDMHVIPYWENEGDIISSDNDNIYEYNTQNYIDRPQELIQDLVTDYMNYVAYFVRLELGLDD